jgi:hypothetical protein
LNPFPQERLLKVKEDHELRVATQSGIAADRASQVLRYAANVGVHRVKMSSQEVSAAMLPERYPMEGRSMIDLSMTGSVREDSEEEFWRTEAENLKRLYASRVRERIDAGEVPHLSVFALAPQPLLVLLGSLIGDITPAQVFQRHREPETWSWPADGKPMELLVQRPASFDGPIALKIALSATIDNSRIHSVLGDEASIWSISTAIPHNDVLKRPEDLAKFRRLLRQLYDEIKAKCGSGTIINLFPAMPVATAVETGRVRMPKADLPMVVWDENRQLGGFRSALEV